MKVWIDGRVVDGARARISVTDHGLLYGDGVFEGLRVCARRVFRLEAHMKRFGISAKAIGLELPGGVDAARNVVLETARAFGEDEAYLRLIATRGEGPLGIDPTDCPEPRLICIADRISVYPESKRRVGIDLLTSTLRQASADARDPRVKSLNYLNNALARLEARQRGADEALLLNATGAVCEVSVANIFAVRESELLTPPGSDGALEGITRATVLELAGSLGIPAREQTLGRFDLLAADEAFATGSAAGLVPIRSLDSRPIGSGSPGPVFEKLSEAFFEASRSRGTAF